MSFPSPLFVETSSSASLHMGLFIWVCSFQPSHRSLFIGISPSESLHMSLFITSSSSQPQRSLTESLKQMAHCILFNFADHQSWACGERRARQPAWRDMRASSIVQRLMISKQQNFSMLFAIYEFAMCTWRFAISLSLRSLEELQASTLWITQWRFLTNRTDLMIEIQIGTNCICSLWTLELFALDLFVLELWKVRDRPEISSRIESFKCI